jgi:hypothetical protein
MNGNRIERYHDALRNIPPSGGGGCHTALLRIANLGRLAGIGRDQVAQDLATNVHGIRRVLRGEIEAAVSKSINSPFTAHISSARPPPLVDGHKLLNAIVERGAAFKEVDLWEASRIRIDWRPEDDAIEILRRLYHPEDRLFAGARYEADSDHVLPVSEWISRIERGIAVPEHFIPNVLSGQQGQTKNGKRSYRADSCVAGFRFAVVEFDAMPRIQQITFWAGAPLPVVALIDSGGKSIHGWIRIDAANADEWAQRVENTLFTLLTAVGADGACKNEARLSRMPGHFRAERGHWQRLLYLDPAGGPVLP